jgi:protease II
MRAFIISLVFILVIICMSVVNHVYINTFADLMTETVVSHDAGIDNVMFLWSKHKRFVSLTVNSENIYDTDEAIKNMIIYSQDRNSPEFEASREIFLLCIRRIKNVECISIYNII